VVVGLFLSNSSPTERIGFNVVAGMGGELRQHRDMTQCPHRDRNLFEEAANAAD
jgi:hypothetical protein